MAARTPGPIAAPEPLLAVLGVSHHPHHALAGANRSPAWRRATDLPTDPEREAVVAVEEALSAELSDMLLAVLASRVPHLEEAFELQLDGLRALAEEAWAGGCSVELLAVARRGDVFYCVPRREHAWSTTTITPWHLLDGAEPPRGLARWLEGAARGDLWELLVGRGGPAGRWQGRGEKAAARAALGGLLAALGAVDPEDDEPLPPAARPDAGVPLTPRLVPQRATILAAGPRVQHAKFGVGRVLRATGAGPDRKLEIDFGAGGVRTILARFVTELPPGA